MGELLVPKSALREMLSHFQKHKRFEVFFSVIRKISTTEFNVNFYVIKYYKILQKCDLRMHLISETVRTDYFYSKQNGSGDKRVGSMTFFEISPTSTCASLQTDLLV